MVQRNEPELRPLAYADLPRAVDMFMKANEDNPSRHYIDDTPDACAKASKFANWIGLFIGSARAAIKHEAWTIGGGDSVVCYSSPSDTLSRRRKRLYTILDWLVDASDKSLSRIFRSSRQRARRAEFSAKITAAASGGIGNRVDQLISIDYLATAADKQGRGYASRLVNQVTAMADAQSRGTWLFTGQYNVGFYERLGFVNVREFALGDDPTWTKGPVVLCVMLREPQSLDSNLLDRGLRDHNLYDNPTTADVLSL
ncbi:uncharacterized protein FIBRA_02317 [Fibroporia radiculosa]|uniref:N-acetyltransferase domain-containing protein n=1 Tax=Fibroporia radiculosa TaxID=599839 RepID=J4HUQ5_9APHY|nr:uncharacterized protein FIBRA_02317 [Fibroporia radiculosa]CCM00287.1 predicted protein [Fibroporia radiculosa]